MRKNNGQAGSDLKFYPQVASSDEVLGRAVRSLALSRLVAEIGSANLSRMSDDELFRAIWSAPGRLLVDDQAK